MIYGTDVSNYQPINFLLELPGESVRPIDFAIIKITEGMSYTNPKWVAQRQWARDHGLSVGFYHFARPGSMTDQADYFLSRVALQPGDHLWFDWEDAGVSNAQKDAWIRYVQEQRPGHRVGLYCNTYFWKNRDTTSFAGDGLWIATGGIEQAQPPIESDWLIHQFSTAGDYDHDIAQFGSRADMVAWARGEEPDMALTQAEIDKIAAAVYNRIFKTDDVLAAPPDAPNYETNKFWTFQTHVQAQTTTARATQTDVDKALELLGNILSQARTNGTSLSEIKTVLAGLDLTGLPDAVAVKLAAFRLKLEEQA